MKKIIMAAFAGGFALTASLGVAQAIPSLEDPDLARPHVETNEDVMLSPWTPNTEDHLMPSGMGTRTFIVPDGANIQAPGTVVRVVPQPGVVLVPEEEVVIVPMR